MSTHSMIGRVTVDGTVRAIYCHFDGYPQHHIPRLVKYWNDDAKVRTLIGKGDLETLDSTCEVLDPVVSARRYASRAFFMLEGFHTGADYLYLWDGTGWLVCDRGQSEFRAVDPTLYAKQLEAQVVRQQAENARAARVTEESAMFAETVDELARRATDPDWGKKAALVEEHDEERIAWMLGYLRKNVGDLASEWVNCEEG